MDSESSSMESQPSDARILRSLQAGLSTDACDYRPRQEIDPSTEEESTHPYRDRVYSEVKGEPDRFLADRFWTKYLNKNKKYDKEQIEIWKSDADGILIFTGLFSATVAAFIVESYKRLEPDSGDTTVVLLSQLVAIINGTQPPAFPASPFSAPRTILDVNIFWFFSLILSLTCALGATLVQQWTRNYSQAVFDEHTPPRERGRLRAFLSAGLVEFLWQINRSVALAALILVGIVALLYATITHLPLFLFDCPYRTPLTSVVWPFIHAFSKQYKGLRDLFSFSSSAPSRRRFHDFVRILRGSYAYRTLDEYYKDHRSTNRTFGTSDVDALAEIAADVTSSYSTRSVVDFAMEIPVVVTCTPSFQGPPLEAFSSHSEFRDILYILQSLLFRLEDSVYLGSVSLTHSHSVIIAMKILSCLTLCEYRGFLHAFHPSPPSEVRRAVPHIIKSTSVLLELGISAIESLSRHEDYDTACRARGVVGLAVLARLQRSLSQRHPEVEPYDMENIPAILRAVFPHERIPEDLMADDEGILANGTCIVALCVLSDLDATADPYGWKEKPYSIHLHTLVQLSTLSQYVGHTAPEIRQRFVHRWGELDAPPVSWVERGRKKEAAELLKSLHDVLKASQDTDLVVVVGGETEGHPIPMTQNSDEGRPSTGERRELNGRPDTGATMPGRIRGREVRAEGREDRAIEVGQGEEDRDGNGNEEAGAEVDGS